MTYKTIRKDLPKAWKELLKWQKVTHTKLNNHQWIEEWIVKDGSI